jgi:hypothetical protein
MSTKKEINSLVELIIAKLDQDQQRFEEERHQEILQWQNALAGHHTEDCLAYHRIYNEYRCYLNFNFFECDIIFNE